MARKEYVATTKEDIVKFIKLWKECQTKQEVIEKMGRDKYWVSRMLFLIRKTHPDLLPKKTSTSRIRLAELLAEAYKELGV